MFFKILHTLLTYIIVYVIAFDDIYVNGEIPSDMIEKGRAQYHLLKERGTLPQYGNCWKSAVINLEDGCRYLSEDIQSEIALSLTNCFLIMSGHDPYNCLNDKKANLRAICINQMSDRAFNVYTEFYTHTQNICWFLRGQIWQETLSENTFKLTKQLELSARNQADLLKQQQESLQRQQKILNNSKLLEKILDDLFQTTNLNREILTILTQSLTNLQAWIIGEISWFDSLIFYLISGLSCLILTSIERTTRARLPTLLILISNLILERLICLFLLNKNQILFDSGLIYDDIRNYIWYCRYFFIISIIIYLLISAYNYQDLLVENYKFLQIINEQNCRILNNFEKLYNNNNSIKFNGNLSDNDQENSSKSNVNDYLNNNNNNNSISIGRYARKPLGNRYFLRSSRQNTPEI